MRIFKSFLFVMAAALAMIACSSDNDSQASKSQQAVTKTLHISIQGNAGTRASGTPAAADEAKINNLVIGIYDNTNKRLESRKTIANPDVTGNEITTTVSYTTTKPSVIVLANVPEDILNQVPITGAEEAIKALAVNLDVTANADKTSQEAKQLPMVGSTDKVTAVTKDGETSTTEFNASVVLNRMVSRVALTKIDVAGLPSGDQFTVTDVFVRHAYTSSTILNEAIASSTNFTLTGFPVVSEYAIGMAGEGNDNDGLVKAYLANAYTAAWSDANQAYFYIFPNGNSDFKDRTQLVIKGNYTKSGAETSTVVYYPIVVNREANANISYTDASVAGAGTGTVQANHQYNIEAEITGAGQSGDDFNQDVDPSTNLKVNLTVSVADWAAVITQHAKF